VKKDKLFKKAVDDFPERAQLDLVSQKDINDLAWAVRIELDCLLEGQGEYRDMDGRTKRGYRIRMQNYLEKYKDHHDAPLKY